MRLALSFLGAFAMLTGAGSTIATLSAAPAKSSFDGLWSLLVVTEAGECDRAYRYALRITNGSVTYQGEAGGVGIDVSGQVDGSGRISVSIGNGKQNASGVGRMANGSGAGTWKGKSSTAECSGRWEAERRGA